MVELISFGLIPALASNQMAVWNQWLITMGWGDNCTLNLAVVLTHCCHEIYGFLHTMPMMRPNKLSAKQLSLPNYVTGEMIIILASQKNLETTTT